MANAEQTANEISKQLLSFLTQNNTEINTTLSKVHSNTNTISDRVYALEKTLGTLEEKTQNNTEQIIKVVDQLIDQRTQNVDEFTSIEKAFTSLQERIDTLNTSVTDITGQLASNLKKMEQSNQNQTDAISDLQKKFIENTHVLKDFYLVVDKLAKQLTEKVKESKSVYLKKINQKLLDFALNKPDEKK